MKVIADTTATVIVPNKGDNYHLTADCRGIWRGQLQSEAFGRNVWATDEMSIDDALNLGKYGCLICYKAAGIDIPAEANRHLVRAERRRVRAEQRALVAALARVAFAVAYYTANKA